MMRSIIISLLVFLFSILISMFFLRFRLVRKGNLGNFVIVYFLSFLCYVLMYLFFPNDLRLFRGTPDSFDFWNGILIFTLLFHCFVDVVYTTVLTGFAVNLLIHIKKHKKLSLGQVKAIYAEGGKGNFLISSRFKDLVDRGYISTESLGYRLRPKGFFVGTTARVLQKLFRMEATG